MSEVLALVPARAGSKGVPLKNFKPLAGGLSCADRALLCVRRAGIPASQIILSTDADYPDEPPHAEIAFRLLKRPAELAQDTTPMLDVVRHAMAEYPGDSDDIWLIAQPTQPLRTPDHVKAAIALLRGSGADSVVSVVPLPLTHHPRMQIEERGGRLFPYYQGTDHEVDDDSPRHLTRRATHWRWALPKRRQDLEPVYIRDGTVYAFWRKTVETHGTIYGQDVRPLIIYPEETCPLDTPEDWAEAERRLRV